jgi:hypothetical protein
MLYQLSYAPIGLKPRNPPHFMAQSTTPPHAGHPEHRPASS